METENNLMNLNKTFVINRSCAFALNCMQFTPLCLCNVVDIGRALCSNKQQPTQNQKFSMFKVDALTTTILH